MDGFQYLDQWYFDYCVYCTINNALKNQWSEVRDIEKKCMVLLAGSLETGDKGQNRKKAQMLIIIFFCNKVLSVENDEDCEGCSILNMLDELTNNLKSLHDLVKDDNDLKLCIIAVLRYGIQLCSEENTTLTPEEREYFKNECFSRLQTFTDFSNLRKTTLRISTVVEAIVQVIAKHYNAMSTAYIMELLHKAKEDELDAELRDLDNETNACLTPHLDKWIIDYGGDPHANLKAEIETIKEKLAANKEVQNFLSRLASKTDAVTPLNLNSSHLNPPKSTAVQTHSTPANSVFCQTEISNLAFVVVPPGPQMTLASKCSTLKSLNGNDRQSGHEEDELGDDDQSREKKTTRVVSSSSDLIESSSTGDIFKRKLRTVAVNPTLMNIKLTTKPPSHDIVYKGKWTHEEEEKLLEATFTYGEGNWADIKVAMNSLRSSQQLKDKWRNIPNSRKKAFERRNSNK